MLQLENRGTNLDHCIKTAARVHSEKEQLLHAASLLFLCHTSTELWNLICKGLCHPLSIGNFTKG